MSSNELDIKYHPNKEANHMTVSEQEVSKYVEARMQEILQMIIREISRADIKDPLTYGIVMTGEEPNFVTYHLSLKKVSK